MVDATGMTGKKIGPYEITALLGASDMGEVDKAGPRE